MSAEELLLQLFSDALKKTRDKKTKRLVESKRSGPMAEEPEEAPEMSPDEMKLVLEMESGDEEKEDEMEKRRKSMLG
jgi:hypothetical protein